MDLVVHHQHRASLGERLDDQHPRQDWIFREMPPERIIAFKADGFFAHDALARLDLGDAVDQQERRPVWDELLDLLRVELGHAMPNWLARSPKTWATKSNDGSGGGGFSPFGPHSIGRGTSAVCSPARWAP